MQQQPIFPNRLQLSIFGASELNFCVRYENRWDLTANVTAMVYIQAFRPNISFPSSVALTRQIHNCIEATFQYTFSPWLNLVISSSFRILRNSLLSHL